MFQSFDPPALGASAGVMAARLEALRARFDAHGVDGVLVPHADAYQGEYLPPSAERLAYVTGFTGSAGLALVTRDRAALFVDGRYTLQAGRQADGRAFEIVPSGEVSPSQWIRTELDAGTRLGFDPRLNTREEVKRLREAAAKAGVELVALAQDPVDEIWTDRPAEPMAPVSIQPLEYAGRSAAEKLSAIVDGLAGDGADAALIASTDGVAWLFNIRGGDIAHTPVALARAIVPKSGRPTLFIDAAKLSADVRAEIEAVAEIAPPTAIEDALTALGRAGGTLLADPAAASEHFFAVVEAAGGRILEGREPTTLPRAIKTADEIEGARTAHLRDGIALSRFLAWFDRTAPGDLDEIAVAEALERFRRETNRLEEISFDTIAGAGEHGAIVHYRVDRSTCRRLADGELMLVDSGAQYREGTTDVTRTMIVGTPTDEMRRQFTRVLKGHIAIATARFPARTTGAQLDSLARIALWRAGFDFAHGTGHGVGSFLSVHEGPQRISRLGHEPLKPGMILSNEPGYYREGAYGIRIENLVLVCAAEVPAGGERPMHSFETLTLAPIDRRLIVPALMTAAEIAWLDGYHARVCGALAGLLDADTRTWLIAATRPLC